MKRVYSLMNDRGEWLWVKGVLIVRKEDGMIDVWRVSRKELESLRFDEMVSGVLDGVWEEKEF